MNMVKKNRMRIMLAIFAVFLVLVLILLVVHSQRNISVRDSPVSTHTPDGENSYWNKERMESASPAPMPSR